jgi:hypothetical protein
MVFVEVAGASSAVGPAPAGIVTKKWVFLTTVRVSFTDWYCFAGISEDIALHATTARHRIPGTILTFFVANALAFIVVVADDVFVCTVGHVRIFKAIVIDAALV